MFVIAELINQETIYRAIEFDDVRGILKAFAIKTSRKRKEDEAETNLTSKVIRILIEIIEKGMVIPIQVTDEGSYYDRDELFQAFRTRYSEDFPYINTVTKMVRLINEKLNINLINYRNNGNRKRYFIKNGFLEEFRERYL